MEVRRMRNADSLNPVYAESPAGITRRPSHDDELLTRVLVASQRAPLPVNRP